MIAKSRVPEIRFKGFSGDISHIKLHEIVISNTYGPRFNANDYDIKGNVKTIRGTDISLNGNILYHQVPIASLDSDFIKSHILEDGDLVMITTADCGLTGIFEKQEDNYICSAYAVKITLNQKLAFPNYFKYFFQTHIAKNEVDKFLRKATISNLPASDILKIAIRLPLILEQKKIASFLTFLYQLIEQKEKKHKKLKQLKKTMLSKMVPKEGEDTPEIRFKGFRGGWEEKELGDVSTITMGQSPEGIYYTNNPEDYILVQGNADIKNGIVVPRIWTKKITKMADIGDMIFSVRAPVGEVGKTNYSVVIGRGVASIKGNEFIFQILKKMNKDNYWKKLSAGSTFDSINSNDLLSAIIPITNLNEQTKIGNYFQKLDKLIDLQHQELEKLKNIKKASLDKMFI